MIEIIEDESLEEYADFDDNEVWLLNKTDLYPLKNKDKIVIVPEVAESFDPCSNKFNKLLTEVYEKYNGESVDYVVTTRDPEKYAVHLDINGEDYKTYVTGNFKIVS